MAESSGKNNWIYLSLGVIATVGLLIFAFKSKNVDWRNTYYPESKQPYNTWLLQQLMEKKFEGNFYKIQDSLNQAFDLDTIPLHAVYFFVGEKPYLDSLETLHLLEFVEEGRTAFLSSEQLAGRLSDMILGNIVYKDAEKYEDYSDNDSTLLNDDLETWDKLVDSTYQDSSYIHDMDYEDDYTDQYYDYYDDPSYLLFHLDTAIQLSFKEPYDITKIAFINYVYEDEVLNREWAYFQDSILTPAGIPIECIGTFNNIYPNMISIPYGKGNIILHSTPLIFTNYHLNKKEAFDYASACISTIPNNAVILWDEESLNYRHGTLTNSDINNSYKPNKGPLSFILSQRSLKWAWYILMLGGVFYLILGSKRKQKPIPVIEKRRNSSIDFAETLSQLYGRNSDHRQIAQLKWRLFLGYLRRNYGLNTLIPDEKSRADLIIKIAIKSGLSQTDIEELFRSYLRILSAVEVDGDMLSDFHNKTSYFYKTSK